MEQNLFSIKGRITRGTFWFRYFIFFILLILISSSSFAGDSIAITAIRAILLFLNWIFLLIQCIKRMHDINMSGFFLFVPIINLVFAFRDGTIGKNIYGDDPKRRI